MHATMYVVVAVIGIATALNLSLTFAVIRRLRDAEAPTVPIDDKLPKVGAAVAEFTAETLSGRTLSRSDIAEGNAVVGFVAVGCGPCGELVDALADEPDASPDGRLFFVSGDPAAEDTRAMVARLAGFGEVVVGLDRPVSDAFGGIDTFPTLLRLDGGVITRTGRSLTSMTRLRTPAGAGGRGQSA